MLILTSLVTLAFAAQLKLVTKFDMNKPAFATVHNTSDGKIDLIINTFGVSFFGDKTRPVDGVYYIEDMSSKLKALENGADQHFESKLLGGSGVTWPNEVEFEADGTMLVAGGFLVPGKKGQISRLNYEEAKLGKSKWEHLVNGDKNGFYHRVRKQKVKPASGQDDGYRYVACRARKGIFNQGDGEMLYLEEKDGQVEQHIIAPGCDVYFIAVDLNNDGVDEYILSQFFTKKLVLQWTEDSQGDWTKTESVKQRVISDDIGAVFNVDYVDIQGVKKLLVTNHQGVKDTIKPAVFTFDIKLPQESEQLVLGVNKVTEFMEGVKFDKKVLAEGFPVTSRQMGSAAPGGAVLAGDHIIVSGDGSKKAYIMTPTNGGKYVTEEFHDCEGTAGGITVADMNNDGFQEVVVPCYDKNYVAIYTFKQ